MLNLLKKIFTHRYLALVLRLYIGGLFIYASVYKINYPAEFAESIASYQIVPYWALGFMAAVLPWVELVCGFLLIVGFRARSSAAVICALLLVFSLAVLLTILRDIPIGCGCFHGLEDPMTWNTFFRDLAWLAMALHVFFFDKAFHLEDRFSFSLKEIEV